MVVFAQWHTTDGLLKWLKFHKFDVNPLTLLKFWLSTSDKIVFNKNACTGAITAQGPPCLCTKADGSLSLNSKPIG